VKNRCKNGDHYWVDAKVVPIKKNGEIIGYMSVRSCPSRQAVAAAENAYREAARDPTTVSGSAEAGWKRHFSIKNGVTLGIVFVTLLMVAGGILGITGLTMSNSALRSLYYEEMEPVQTIGRINFLMADNRVQVALAMHHNPMAHSAEQFDHGLNAHIAAMDKNKREIDVLWANYARSIKNDVEKDLSDRYWRSRNRYVEEGLMAAKSALLRADYPQAERLLLVKVTPLYDEANSNVNLLLKHLSERGKSNFDLVTERNRGIAAVAVAGIALGSLMMILAGVYFFRATVMPLQRAVVALENIAEGNLSDTIDADAHGEPGRVMAAVAVMQMHLKVMMDEIRQSSGSIREQCRNLNQTMMNLAEQSEEQHDRIYQTLDASLDAGAGLSALAANAEGLMQAVEGVAPEAADELEGGSQPGCRDGESLVLPVLEAESSDPFPLEANPDNGLNSLAREVAGAARIQSFALEDVAAQLKQVASLIVQNREEVQGAWAASQQLEKTALELDKLVKYFES
ncbi:MAG: Tar ligand binding domain-containing protein, partial [Sulfuricella sp.]